MSKRSLNDREHSVEWKNDFKFLENHFEWVSSVPIIGEADYDLVP